jgi:ABC-type glycerol-3-phosphate transport system permease component
VIGWPAGLAWQNWSQAWSGYCIAQRCEGIQPYMVNSFLLVIPATILSTALARSPATRSRCGDSAATRCCSRSC